MYLRGATQNLRRPRQRLYVRETVVVPIEIEDMMLKSSYFHKRWRKVKSELLSVWLLKYKMCLSRLKKYLTFKDVAESQRRKSHAKLHPLPDRPIRRAASKLIRKPTNEIERLRRKGDNWTANDLFRFQYSDPEEGTTEERRELCYAWLERLQAISKKFCYLAWYEAAIYACYYRLAPIIVETEEKRKIWTDVKREYAQIFLMGRRIWRRPSHPSRLRVLYDMAMLCVRFGNVEDDPTSQQFRESLADADNFDHRVLDEVEFAKSVDKVTLLENFVIDQFYVNRRSSGSFRSSLRYKKSVERSPSRKSAVERSPSRKSAVERSPSRKSAMERSPSRKSAVERSPSRKSAAVDEQEVRPASSKEAASVEAKPAEPEIDTVGRSVNDLTLNSSAADDPSPTCDGAPAAQPGGVSRASSVRSVASPRLVHFSDDECVEQV
ncbi:hypothetical protein Y032_0196g1538 [Ancylostoma ceylanicum]|uniref:DUF7758 domain-containing protein n=1 Tax=Ancylostoma ceylanicum TaxID=53326 RepID=A0A016SNI2_9BILA|nr:hypothetical protein Y032_0196g1538 [Ancylostoma ceylanicum]